MTLKSIPDTTAQNYTAYYYNTPAGNNAGTKTVSGYFPPGVYRYSVGATNQTNVNLYAIDNPSYSSLTLAGQTVTPKINLNSGSDSFFTTTFSNSLTITVNTTWKSADTTNSVTGGQEIAYGNSLFVLVGYQGQLATSTDGITWTSRTSSFGTSTIYSVVYGNGTWVAVAEGGQIRTSTDAITWTSRTSNATNTFYKVGFGNSLFVAVGGPAGGNQIRSSTDGITWTTRTVTYALPWTKLAYGAGRWVVAGSNASSTSTDGITWGATSSTAFAGSTLSDLVFVNNRFLASSSSWNNLKTSTDGVTWTFTASFGVTSGGTLSAIMYGNSQYVVMQGTTNALPGYANASTDLVTWTTTQASPLTTNTTSFKNGLYVNGNYFAVFNPNNSSVVYANNLSTVNAPGCVFLEYMGNNQVV